MGGAKSNCAGLSEWISFEAFMRSRVVEGVNERSARQRDLVVSYVLADGVQNSLARRKP